MSTRLPIDDVLPALLDALRTSPRVMLHAPPGAGKTTRVPVAVLRESGAWLGRSRVIMLEPRRLAARAAASYMARQLGEQVGETVGYRIRLDSRVSARTRIEIVTEGVLTRMLQDDATLDGVALVIFDEFHERSIHADTALAFALQTQSLLRPDLRLLVMSATLDVESVTALLGPVPVVRSEGQAFPVETIHVDRPVTDRIEAATAARTVLAHDRHDGDVLVFLPGAAEIRRTADHLRNAALPSSTHVIPLHGEMPQHEQDRAIAPSPPGRRKIVLATSIAETSLTIEGVRIVVDSGLMRVPRFSPRSGMTRLATVRVSRAAADQRRGRAGRTGPGVCYRLWTAAEHATLLAHRPPEIMEADLAPLALDLAAWGIADPAELRWIDPPPAAAFAQARELLRELEAIDDDGALTAHGRAMAQLALHPRLAHMLLRARDSDCTGTAAAMAALLEERDVLRGIDGATDPDMRLRLAALAGAAPMIGMTVDRATLHRVRRIAQQRSRAADGKVRIAEDCAGRLLAFAYPDRIGRRQRRGRFLLRSGTVAVIDPAFPLAESEFIVAAELGGSGRTTRVFRGSAISRSEVESSFDGQIEEVTRVEYVPDADAVRAWNERRLSAIVLEERRLQDIAQADVQRAITDHVRSAGIDALPWMDASRELRARLAFLHHVDPDSWPDVSDDALLARLDEWLVPWLGDARCGTVLRGIDLREALLGLVDWERRNGVDRLAPTHIEVPSGSRIRIDYSDPAAPVLAVRLQEMFGATDTPRIAGGRVPLTLHLLSPARRPVQVTRDLASFWRTTYFDVRKDLRGRYPKHYWPDDPLVAEATRRTRPRGR